MTGKGVCPVLEIRSLSGGPVGHPIIKDVSLTVDPGEVVALMGPNGSGKSTLANLVMGRPGHEITSGEIYVSGVDITRLPPHERARAGVSVAYQYPVELPGVPIGAVLSAALGQHGGVAGLDAQIERLAGEVGLDRTLLSRGLNDDFSGGEKKRAEMIQLALIRPAVMLLDEIDSGLDVDALRRVARKIEEMRAGGTGILLVTHYERLLEHVKPDRVLVMQDGQIVRSGGPELARILEEEGYVLSSE